jgi:hypothetical protein
MVCQVLDKETIRIEILQHLSVAKRGFTIKQRYVIERTNNWMGSFISILNRFDFTVSSWKSFNYIAFGYSIQKN